MALSLFPVFSLTASAALSGSGTEANPYLITSVDDMITLYNGSQANITDIKYYKLTTDIDMSEVYAEKPNFHIGNTRYGGGGELGEYFMGVFDGDNHTISGLKKPLFNLISSKSGTLTTSEIKNLVIEGEEVSGAVLLNNAGSSYSTLIVSNCHYKGGTATGAGFIESWLSRGAVVFNNCSVNADTVTNAGFIGNLGGRNYTACTATFNKCFVSANVTSTTNAGGFVGGTYAAVNMNDCYYSGAVNGTNYSGSFVGYRYTGMASQFSRCYSYDTEYNSLIGYNNATRITNTNVYYLVLTADFAGDQGNGTTGLTAEQFADITSYGSTFTNFDFTSENPVWKTSSYGRPVLVNPEEKASRKLEITSSGEVDAVYGDPKTVLMTDYVTLNTGESTADQVTYTIKDEDNEVLASEPAYDPETGEETGVTNTYLATVSGSSVVFSEFASVGPHTVTITGEYDPEALEAAGIEPLLGDNAKTFTVTITENVKAVVSNPLPSVDTFAYSRSIKLKQIRLTDGWRWAEPNTIPKDNKSYTVVYPIEDASVKDYYIYQGVGGYNYDADYGGIVDTVALYVSESAESPWQVTVTVINADTEAVVEGATVSSTFDYEFPTNTTDENGQVTGELTTGQHTVYANKDGFDEGEASLTVVGDNSNVVTVPITPKRAEVTLPVLRDDKGGVVADAKLTVTRTSDNIVAAKAWNNGNDAMRVAAGSTQQFATGNYRIDATSYGYAGKTIYMVITYDVETDTFTTTYYRNADHSTVLDAADLVEALKSTKLGSPVYHVQIERTLTTVIATVTLQNLKVTSGTFGLRYDSDKFTLTPATGVVFNNANNIYLDKTPETTYASNISAEDATWTNDLGYYVARWRAGENESDNAELNTENEAIRIVTFTFDLNSGVDVLNDITNDSFSVMPWDETKAARAYKAWYDTTCAGNPEAEGLYKFEEYWRDTDIANSASALQQGRIESSKAVVNGIDTGGFFQAAVNEDLSSENLASFYDVMTELEYGFKIKNTALRFTVYDRATDEPLPNAKVRLYSLGETLPQTDTTDDLGRVTFMVNTSAGNEVTYTYSVERDGYWPIPETLAAEDREAVTVTPNVAKNVDVPMDLRIYHVPEVLGDTLTLTGKGDLAGERFAYNGHDFHFRVKAAPGYKIETYPTKATVTVGEPGEEGYYTDEIEPNEDKLFIIEGVNLNQPAILGDDNLQRVFGEGWDQFRQPNEDGYRSYNIKIEFDQFVAVPADLQVTALAGTNGKVSYDGTGSEFDSADEVEADHNYKITGIEPDVESHNTVGKFTFTGDTYTAEVDGEEKELQYQVDKVFINGVQVHDYDNETQFEYIVGDVKQDTDIAVTFWDGVTHSSDSVMTLVVGDYGEADVTAPVVDEDIRLTRRTYLNPDPNLAFKAVPDAGYELYSIRTQLDDELPVEYDLSGVADKAVSNDFTFDPVAGRSEKVYVTFKNPLAEITPTVFVKSYVESGSGTITPFGLLVYNIYDTVTLDLAADTENKWDVSGVKVSPYGKNDEGTVRSFPEIKTTNQYVIDSIQTDTEVGAIFEEHKYTVTGKVDLSQGKDLWSGGGDGYGDVMSGATVTFYRTGDVNGEALDEEMAIPTVTTANRTEAVFTAAIPAGTWKVVVSKQGYVNYIITGYLLNPATDPAEGDAIQFAENNKVITPVIGSTTDGKAVSLIDAAGVRSGMRDNITNAAKAKADVDNNGTPDTLDMAFVLANFGARTTYVKYDDVFKN